MSVRSKLSKFEIIVIGGSAGSLPVVINILEALPTEYCIPVVIILHRIKNVFSEMDKILSFNYKGMQITEPEDKTLIEDCHIYLAPQNYHLLAEEDKTFSLDYSELVNYSRPSIDVTFNSISQVYKDKTLGVLLSGANNDGADGINSIIMNGGTGIVQHPDTAEYTVMPNAAIKLNNKVRILRTEEIVDYFMSLYFNS